MVIVETTVFTRQIIKLISDEDYSELQKELITNPRLGKVMPGGGGIRKVRWASKGHGKRGGARIIYFWFVELKKLLFLFAYPKNMQENLTKAQLKLLRTIVEEEYK
jgi:hypothetical protein